MLLGEYISERQKRAYILSNKYSVKELHLRTGLSINTCAKIKRGEKVTSRVMQKFIEMMGEPTTPQ